MTIAKVRNLALTVILMAAVVAANAFLLHGRLSHWAADFAAPVLAPLTARTAGAHAFIGTLLRRDDLAAENIRLSEQLAQLRAQAASTEELKKELEFYRAAAGIRVALGTEPRAAAIFTFPRAGGIREAVINRGARHWVASGDVVITAAGALVGVVRETFDDHAVVLTLGDPTLEVTGRILDTQVTGLVRYTTTGGLVLDLVSRDEAVSEGQVVVTSGNDRFPAGLVLGVVRSVDAEQTTLFTIVRLEQSAPMPAEGKVLIIRP